MNLSSITDLSLKHHLLIINNSYTCHIHNIREDLARKDATLSMNHQSIHEISTNKYLDYCNNTQERWMLYGYVNTDHLLEHLSNNIAQNSVVKEIQISVPVTTPNIRTFATALATNNSLTSLDLCDTRHYPDCDLQPLLEVVARKKELRSLHISSTEKALAGNLFPQVLEICRNCTELTELTLEDEFTEEQILRLFTALDGHSRLNELRLGDIDHWSRGTLSALALFLNENKNIVHYPGQIARDALEFLSEKTNTRVFEGTRDHAATHVIDEELDKIEESSEHEANTMELFIDVLPQEISKMILKSLNIGPLMAFFQTNKRALEYSRSYEWWRDYYLSHFDSIPEDILEFISVKYGDTLLNRRSIDELRIPTNIWILAIRAMAELYRIDPVDLPRDRNSLIQLVSKPFPQLRSLDESVEAKSDSLVWFTSTCGAYEVYWTVHKLGLQYRAESNQYSAILLRKHEYVDMFPRQVDPYERMDHVLDWTAAHEVAQFIEQVKSLIEQLLLLNYNSEFNLSHQVVPGFKLDDHFTSLCSSTQAITDRITNYVEALIIETSPIDLQSIDSFISRLMQLPWLQLDCALHKQQLPKRSECELLKAYLNNHKAYQFYREDWSDLAKGHHYATVNSKQRKQKKIAKAMLLRFIRLMLNYLLMPVLQLFWPRDTSDSDFNAYCFAMKYNFTPQFQQYYSPFVTIDNISINHSFPSHWPPIATGIGHVVLEPILTIATSVLRHGPLFTAVNQFIRTLQVIGFHSNSDLKNVERLFLRPVDAQ